MYPHERSLVKRLEKKPFALLGVNSDTDRVATQRAIKDNGLDWRSWWDGGGVGGPIATRWKINRWPTVYVIDAKGVIRYKDVRGDELDRAVDALLAELESAR